jgi:3-oxoacyl-[acyl-carrier protein] reductase
MKRLEGKIAIITGAGRGIGKAIALAFGGEGANLVLVARTLSEVEETAAAVRELGCRAIALAADISRHKHVAAVVTAAHGEFGRVDILVNNAGIYGPIGPLVSNDPESWLETIKINLFGTFLCTQALLPSMMRQGHGKIINLSGGGATSERPYFTAYAASKAATVRLTDSLAQEVKEHNIQVNAIAPGGASTRLTEEVLAAGEAAGAKDLAEAQRIKAEGGSLEKVTALAVFLASDESSGLTGRLISATWDDWQTMKERIPEIMASELYTLRRVV